MQDRSAAPQRCGVRRLAAASLAALALSLSACGRTASEDGLAPVVDAASIAATVNGEPIYSSDVQLEAEAQGLAEPGDVLESDSAEFHAILDELIDIKLLALDAEARGLEEDPAVRHRLETAREHILGNALMDTIVAEKVDEAAIRKMYDAQIEAQIAAGQLGEEARVRHIMADSKDAIDKIVGELRGGADFALLASQKSTDDATKLEGGDLGFLTLEKAGKMSPELSLAVQATPTGGVSRPFQSSIGWHVIRVDERRKEQPPSIDELRDPIMNFMRTEQIDETLKQLRSEARIERRGAPRDAPLDTDPFRLAPTEPEPGAPARRTAPVEAQAQERPPAATPLAPAPASPAAPVAGAQAPSAQTPANGSEASGP